VPSVNPARHTAADGLINPDNVWWLGDKSVHHAICASPPGAEAMPKLLEIEQAERMGSVKSVTPPLS